MIEKKELRIKIVQIQSDVSETRKTERSWCYLAYWVCTPLYGKWWVLSDMRLLTKGSAVRLRSKKRSCVEQRSVPTKSISRQTSPADGAPSFCTVGSCGLWHGGRSWSSCPSLKKYSQKYFYIGVMVDVCFDPPNRLKDQAKQVMWGPTPKSQCYAKIVPWRWQEPQLIPFHWFYRDEAQRDSL